MCHLENGEEARHRQSESRDLEEGEDVEVVMIGVTEAEAEAGGSHIVCQRLLDKLYGRIIAQVESMLESTAAKNAALLYPNCESLLAFKTSN